MVGGPSGLSSPLVQVNQRLPKKVSHDRHHRIEIALELVAQRSAARRKPGSRSNPSGSNYRNDGGGHLSGHVPAFVKTNFPYAGTLVIVSCPKGSQWETGLSDVANPGKPPGPGLRVATARMAVMLKAAREPLPSRQA